MFKRIKNLWKLSEFRPEESDHDDLVLKRDIYKKKEQKLATIVEDDPIEQFPIEDPEKI